MCAQRKEAARGGRPPADRGERAQRDPPRRHLDLALRPPAREKCRSRGLSPPLCGISWRRPPASECETRQGLRLERRGRGAHSLVAEGTRGQPGATRPPERGHRERVTLAEARARGRLGPGTPPRLRGSTGVPAAGRDELRAQFSETGRRVVPTSRWSSGAGKTEGCRGRAVPLTPRPRLTPRSFEHPGPQ